MTPIFSRRKYYSTQIKPIKKADYFLSLYVLTQIVGKHIRFPDITGKTNARLTCYRPWAILPICRSMLRLMPNQKYPLISTFHTMNFPYNRAYSGNLRPYIAQALLLAFFKNRASRIASLISKKVFSSIKCFVL